MLTNLKTAILATFASAVIGTLFIAAAAGPALTPTMGVVA